MNRFNYADWILSATLGGCLLLIGCASTPEKKLRSRYRETNISGYETTSEPAVHAPFNTESNFEAYMQYAFTNSPKLKAAFARWKAALERIPQARSLEDPELSFEYFIQQMDTRYQVSLTQKFPSFGKLGLREKSVTAEAEAAMHLFEAERVDLYDRVSKAFFEYYYLSRTTAVAAENLQLLADLETVVNSRYTSGLTPFSDLIKVQVEKESMANELAAMQDERSAQSSRLAGLLNLRQQHILPWPSVTLSESSILDEPVLASMLETLNPELKAADAMVSAGIYRQKLAHRSYLPDFILGASGMVMPGERSMNDETDVAFMAGISLPIWHGKYRAEIREAEAETRAAVSEKADLSNMLRAELSMAVFKTRDAERRMALFNTSLIPKAEQSLAVAKQEFSSGKADFMTLIDAQRTRLEFQRMAERAVVDRELALADIGCCIGKFDISSLNLTNGVPHETN
jgi:cobalt-zinc-cadmium efflux system outer membrane protein